MKKVCYYCETPIHIERGQELKRCAICKQAICNNDLFSCCLCGNKTCKGDLVNWDPNRVYRKTGDWKDLKCKSCYKAEKAVMI